MTAGSSTCEFLLPELSAVGDTACRMLDFGEEQELLGEAILVKVRGLIDRKQVTSADVVRMALVADVLRVAEETILADDTVTDREVDYALPLVRDAARRLAMFRAYYESWRDVGPEGVRGFMKEHRGDKQLFGGACSQTRWLGLEIVSRLANETRDRGALDRYSVLMLRLYEEIVSLEQDRVPSAEARQRIEERLGLRKKLEHADRNAPKPEEDPRIAAFCSPDAPPVFHSVELANQVWLKDPFDVESVQSAPRQTFARLLQRAGNGGSVMVVLGDAGSGKTHLMRALRNETHGERSGYVGYMQLAGAPSDWASYVLACLIDSLEKPYSAPEVSQSGLMCLSDALLLAAAPDQRARLKSDDLSDDQLSDQVFALADLVLEQPRFAGLDLDLTRALLFLQSTDARYYTRVVKYLRGQELGRKDAELLGGVAPRADGAFGILSALATVIARVDGGALVLLLDQLEDIFNQASAKEQCRRLMELVRHVSDNVPNAIVVITCLRDFYKELRGEVTKAVLDRLERDAKPLELKDQRSQEDAKAMVGLRMQHLFEQLGVRYRDTEPCFPIPPELVEAHRAFRPRDLIGHLHRYQQACVASGRLLRYDEYNPEAAVEEKVPGPSKFDVEWAEYLASVGGGNLPVPTDDESLLAILGWAVSAKPQGDSVHAGKLLLRITNQTGRGGKLTKQLEALRKDAKKLQRHAVAVRCSEFGGTPGTALAKELGKLAQEGGRPWVVDQATWRQLLAFKQFSEKHSQEAGFADWVRREQPWLQLEDLRKTIGVKVAEPEATPRSVQPPPPEPPEPAKATRSGDAITIGAVVSVRRQTAEITLQSLKQHAAFLGASGSGKTSLALNVIEQAAERGIGVVMLDRKGDLGIYGDPQCWESTDPDPQRVQRLRALRARLDVRMYTPGNPLGRSLRIRAVPPELARLPPHERAQLAGFSAQALLSMAGAGNRADPQQQAILGKAIEVIAQLSSDEPSLREVIDLLADQDESLLAEIGHLDPKHMKKLVDKLEALRLNHSVLLESQDPPLSAESLLGVDGSVPKGRVPMTIISTKFLGGGACVDFWVSQLLIELSRWCSRSPATQLQALLFLDEADAYLPAASKPATKEPLQGLLKRARSAGLGVMLATQSPGDLDYKARDNIATWWVGRIASSTAIEKMKPLLSECRIDISGALATQSTGEFFQISNGNAVRIRSERSLMNTIQLTEDRIVALARAEGSEAQRVA